MLHETANEYFSRSDAFEPLSGVGPDAGISIPTTAYNSFPLTLRPHAGSIYIFQLCLHCVQYPPERLSCRRDDTLSRVHHYEWIDINLPIQFQYHAPRIVPIDTFSMTLLDKIDAGMRSHNLAPNSGWLLSQYPFWECAPMSLLHFAVFTGMTAYVKAKLEDNPISAREEPLLHYAVWGLIDPFFHHSSFEMVDLLLSKGDGVTRSLPWTFPIRRGKHQIRPDGSDSIYLADSRAHTIQCTPTQSISYYRNTNSLCCARVISLLVDRGADPDSIRIWEAFSKEDGQYLPLFHLVVLLDIEPSIKWALLETLCEKGANLTAKDPMGFTFLEAVQMHLSYISAAAFKSLVARGAQITPRMLATPAVFHKFTWRDMNKKEWYERSAQLAARTHHPE